MTTRASNMYFAGAAVAAALLLAAVGVAIARFTFAFLRFRAHLRAALDETSDIRWQRWTGRGFAAAVAGYPLEFDLVPAYLHLRLRRPEEHALITELADVLRRRVPPAAVPPLLLVRDRILPLLKAPGILPPETGYADENLIARRALDDEIVIAYVIEGQFRVTYVTRGMLRTWDLDGDALQALALKNLRARTQHLLVEIGGPRREYAALDGYDAARLLVADLLVPPDVVEPLFAVPHEHLCLVASSAQRGELRRAAQHAHREAAHPLTAALYRWTPAGPERAAS